ncbi:MAG: Fpg/Nei family DNA glycosylase [Candidatus Bipolaricaulota bacterium]|nr:Fpg/Nei family DNA glycosylase [Candidatus Bipolaricaulota bacterium]
MPELPDLEVVAEILTPRIVGRTVRGGELRRPSLLRTGEGSLQELVGAEFQGVSRRGKYLLFPLSTGPYLVVHLMRWAWLWHGSGAYPPSTDTDLRLLLSDGTELRLIESKRPQLAGAWVLPDLAQVEALAKLGPEPLDPGFTPEALRRALGGRRRPLKRLLTDQALLAGIGNAYADEILFQAKLSPFRYAHTLTPDEVDRLWGAIGDTLRWAIGEIRAQAGGKLMDREIRDFLRVHGKRGSPCPSCGTAIAEVLYDEVRTNYCPACQR